ncbi:MAG: alpha/beta fold hydrolase [Acidimicrobiales bacterium]
MRQTSATAGDIDFAILEDGPPEGPLALCLHGFPDTANTWRHLLPELASAGYHAVAPWMRGYAPTSTAPDGSYQTGALAVDAGRLHETFGGDERAVLIGHDWGAAATYAAAVQQPGRWRRAVAMALPPLGAMAESFFSYDQLKRSFYIFVFQSPLAEMAVAQDDLAFIDRLWADWSPGYDGSWDATQVKEALREPANLAAAIGYYRAMFDPTLHLPQYAEAQMAAGGQPPQPTLYLHGVDDGCLGIDCVGDVMPFLSAGSVHRNIEGAGHFLHLERPDEVNALILDFLAG